MYIKKKTNQKKPPSFIKNIKISLSVFIGLKPQEFPYEIWNWPSHIWKNLNRRLVLGSLKISGSQPTQNPRSLSRDLKGAQSVYQHHLSLSRSHPWKPFPLWGGRGKQPSVALGKLMGQPAVKFYWWYPQKLIGIYIDSFKYPFISFRKYL